MVTKTTLTFLVIHTTHFPLLSFCVLCSFFSALSFFYLCPLFSFLSLLCCLLSILLFSCKTSASASYFPLPPVSLFLLQLLLSSRCIQISLFPSIALFIPCLLLQPSLFSHVLGVCSTLFFGAMTQYMICSWKLASSRRSASSIINNLTESPTNTFISKSCFTLPRQHRWVTTC